jgi:hypothetical protein
VKLCPCGCHEACPVSRRADKSGSVAQDVWLKECQCPGAEEKKVRIRAIPNDDAKKQPVSAPKRVFALFRLGLLLRDAYRKQTEEDGVPKVVLLNDRSHQIRDLAMELATTEREDEGAVAELVALTGRHRHDAEVAALDLCTENKCHESRTYNRANRLLRAATTSEPMAQTTAADLATIEAVEDLNEMPPDVMSETLVAKEPRLAEIEAMVRSGGLGARMSLDVMKLTTDERRSFGQEWLERDGKLRSELRPLVGPEAEVDDLALRSYAAKSNVKEYIQRISR